MFAKWAHARPLRHASRKLLYSQGCRRCAQRASPHEESGSVREQGGFVDLSQRVEARQELRLTTELRQGIEIMQMSAVELSDYVKQRVEENPFLDDDDWLYPQHPYEADTYTRTVSTDELAGSSRAAARERAVNGGDADEVRDAERWRSGQDARWGGSASSSLAAGEGFAWDDYFVEGQTLADHLTEQLRLQEDNPRRIAVGELIAGSLDDDGYLTIPLEGIAQVAGVSKAEAADVLRAVQRLDPVGVGVRNLAERLAVQLAARGLYEKPHVKKLVEEGINDLGRLAPAPLAKKLGITVEELDEAFDLLQTCNPHPAAQFGKASASIWPEIVVEPADEPGTYRVRLQDCFLPHLRINAHYKTLAQTEKNRATEEYLKKMLKEAESLLDGIAYRKATLYKVACCVVEEQSSFFDERSGFLRPLSMERVASLTGLSESTVSRVANGNYLQTPRGVFELRYFFQRAAASAGGVDVSQADVMRLIEELVHDEDKRYPMSDQALADELARRGVAVSRRTVAKYRTELGIPSTVFRQHT